MTSSHHFEPSPTVPDVVDCDNSLHCDENTYAEFENAVSFIPVDRIDLIVKAPSSRETYARLKSAERVVKEILQGDVEYTYSRPTKGDRHTPNLTRNGNYAAVLVRNFPFEILETKTLSVRLELFKKVVGALGGAYALEALPGNFAYSEEYMNDPNFVPMCRAGFIKRLVADLQRHGRSRSFQNALKRAQESTKNILEKFVAVVANLFECCSALQVIRVDLSYKESARSMVNVKTAKQNMRRFLNHIRHRTLFKDLLGHMWKFEEGVCDGLHFHCFFLFDAEKVNAGITYSFGLGKFWGELTGGRGKFHSCNANMGSYRYLGIGKVHHADLDMHKTLFTILNYFAKMDQAISDPGVRSYGFSKPVEPTPKSKGGRPRQEVVIGSPFVSQVSNIVPA